MTKVSKEESYKAHIANRNRQESELRKEGYIVFKSCSGYESSYSFTKDGQKTGMAWDSRDAVINYLNKNK